MADDERKRLEDEKKRKQAETDRKRAEVRARLEEASKAKKAKKGFMTPDRKKKLRLLLRKKAAEELKKEQERKAAERRRIIEERCGKPKNTDDASEGVPSRDRIEKITRPKCHAVKFSGPCHTPSSTLSVSENTPCAPVFV